jgi:hypothetical protein
MTGVLFGGVVLPVVSQEKGPRPETKADPPKARPEGTQTPVPVTVDNYNRAESDASFTGVVKRGSFGKLDHSRELKPIDQQTVVRPNRDTLYSEGVFDLDADPVTITMPDAGKRYMSMQLIDQDNYVPAVYYGAGKQTMTREKIGTRYVLPLIRILVDPNDPKDMAKAHELQDAIKVEQPGGPGKFEVPAWDNASLLKVRNALLILGETVDSRNMFGARGEVDPIRHLIGSAVGWGGAPQKAALYIAISPAKNDGTTVHRLTVPADVPVDGFWSISLYNAKGYFQKNDLNLYSINNVTAKKNTNGSVTIQFGGDPKGATNYLPIMPGWNYTVRLYRARPEVLDGKWKFPEAVPVK